MSYKPDTTIDPQTMSREELLAENIALRLELSDSLVAASLKTTQYSNLLENLPQGAQEEDYSEVKKVIDQLKVEGVTNLKEYLEKHPKLIRQMVSGIRMTNVNQSMVDMYEVNSKEECIAEEEDLDEWWSEEWVKFYAKEFDFLDSSQANFKTERYDVKSDGSPFVTDSVSFLVEGYEE